MKYLGTAILFSVVITASPARSHAGASGTTDVACGSTANANNVPAGAVGLSRGDGPIRAVLDAVGEYRTHSFISHGNGWTTHSTAKTPGRPGWPTYCSTPIEPSDLQNGYPGASQINMGGLYQFYYQPEGSPVEALWYQAGPVIASANVGNSVQSWIWSSAPYAWVGSQQNSGSGFYRVGFNGVNGPNTPYTQYSLYQYRDMQGINTGNGWTYNSGNHCASYLSYSQNKAGFGTINNNNTYTHGQVVNGLNAIYNAVDSQCNSGTGFWDDIGAAITCFEGICDDAARQVSNCFADGAGGHCYNDSNRWQQVRDNQWPGGPVDGSGYSTAVSVSPDAIGGWSGHSYGTAAPNPVWSWDGNHTVSWNAPGSTYGCFF